jgi:hypothetical protein
MIYTIEGRKIGNLEDIRAGEIKDLYGAYLKGADLSGADLSGADLRRAYLPGANLTGADLYGADLTGAVLSGANLEGADLEGADLKGANLCRTIGNMKEIKSTRIDIYPIAYTKDILQIGCERHTIEAWRSFSDETISKMAANALDFWKIHKEHIFKTIELNPATTQGEQKMKFWEAMKALEEGHTVHLTGRECHAIKLSEGKITCPGMDSFVLTADDLLEGEWEISKEIYTKDVWMKKIPSHSTEYNVTWLQDVVTGQSMSCPYERNPGFEEYKLYRVTIEEVDSE